MGLVGWVEAALLVGVGAFTAYLGLVTAAAAVAGRRRAGPPPRARNRMAVLVPAHDEAEVLPGLLDALAALDYPPALREVIVVADNCRDGTAALARARGVRVLERDDPRRRGKGHALAWAFARLLPERRHDAFVVLDADSQPAPDLLHHLDRALQEGAAAAQAYCAVGNARASWRTALMAADLALVHYLRPLGRQALGGSAGLQGNGSCLTRRALRAVPWDAVSVAEDQEHHLRLVRAGLRVRFVPGALVWTLMQTTMRAARAQELRWEGGRVRLARRELGRLLAAAVRQRSVAPLDAALDLATPPFALLAALTAALAAARVGAWALAGQPGLPAGLWTGLLAVQAAYVLGGCALAGVPARSYAALLLYGPLYAGAKVGTLARLARRGAGEWVPTPRAERREAA
jgi:GT2 family glycosyltransferase